MSGKVQTYFVSAEFWRDQPEAVTKLLVEETAQHPDDLWIIAIGRADERAFVDDLMTRNGRVRDVGAPER